MKDDQNTSEKTSSGFISKTERNGNLFMYVVKKVQSIYTKIHLLFKVIVGHIFETSIKCLCFIRSQCNFVCMFFKAFWTQLNKFRGKMSIIKTDFILQTCVNF